MQKKRIVYPGDELGTSEECMAGEGTYEKAGKIYAASIGELTLDPATRFAKVIPLTSAPVKLKVGDTVIGIVEDIRSSMMFVNVVKLEGESRQISGDIHTMIGIRDSNQVKFPLSLKFFQEL